MGANCPDDRRLWDFIASPVRRPGLWILTFIASFTAAYTPSVSALGNDVCSWSNSDPDLDPSDQAVTASDPMFTYDGTNYQTQIRGRIEVDPAVKGPPYRLCRRYEITNLSGDTIKALRWPDVGFGPVSETDAGVGYRLPRHMQHNTTDVRNDSTDLYAWENEPANGVTVFPATVESRKAELAPEPGKMYAVDATAFADALTTIQPEGMFLAADYSFFAPTETITLPVLESGFSSPLTTIHTRSSAALFPDDNAVSSVVEITYNWTRDGSATLYAPGISALALLDYTSGQNPTETIGALTDLTKESGARPVNSDESFKFNINYGLSEESDDPAVYVVEHPITLRIGDWSACFMTPVYAPVPISFDNEVHCETP